MGGILADLADALGGRVAVGETFAGELEDGDLVAEVRVTVRRRVATADIPKLREQVLAFLRSGENAGRVTRCAERANPGGAKFTQRSEHNCRKPVSAVVVVDNGPLVGGALGAAEPRYYCVCGTHKDKHRFDPRAVRAVVPLTEKDLAPLRQLAREQEDAAMRRNAERVAAAYAAALGPFRDPVGVPEGFVLVEDKGRVRWERDVGPNVTRRALGGREAETVASVKLRVELGEEGDCIVWEVVRAGRREEFDVVQTRARAFREVLRVGAPCEHTRTAPGHHPDQPRHCLDCHKDL